MNIYEQLVAEVGQEKVNKLILWERSANQRHWGNKLNGALFNRIVPADEPQYHLDIVASVVVEMLDQAKEYEKQCHK